MARKFMVRSTVAKRKSLWLGFQPVSVSINTATSTLLFSLSAAALALRPFTIIRSHFEVMVRSDQSAALEAQVTAIGLAVVSDQAVSVGVTAVPTPITELGSSLWFVHRLMFGESNSLIDLVKPQLNVAIDSKAMRKVEVGSDIVVVIENASVGGSGGAIILTSGRMLIKTN